MKDSSSFLNSIKVDQSVIDKCNEASKNFSQSIDNQNNNSTLNDGGREIGDEGPGSLGREAGNKGESPSNHESESMDSMSFDDGFVADAQSSFDSDSSCSGVDDGAAGIGTDSGISSGSGTGNGADGGVDGGIE